MKQSFEYLKVQTAMDSVDVEDIGNVAIQAMNDFGLEWYLSINTVLGYTTIKEFGPIFMDINKVSKVGFDFNILEAEYNEKKICARINKFLNDPKREITQVTIIEDFELQEKIDFAKDIL